EAEERTGDALERDVLMHLPAPAEDAVGVVLAPLAHEVLEPAQALRLEQGVDGRGCGEPVRSGETGADAALSQFPGGVLGAATQLEAEHAVRVRREGQRAADTGAFGAEGVVAVTGEAGDNAGQRRCNRPCRRLVCEPRGPAAVHAGSVRPEDQA